MQNYVKKYLYIFNLFILKINVPELVTNPTDPGTIDTLCGFLCLTTYFSRAELIKLFLTL